MSGAVLAQALCGAMLRRDEYPSYLRARWADIGGIVPAACRETLTGVTNTVTKGHAASDCRNWLKTLEVEEPKRVELEISKSGSTSGPDPESKVVEETKVDSELLALRRPWRRRSWKAGVLRIGLSHLRAVMEARRVETCRQVYCHACQKKVSRSNIAKHISCLL